MGNFRILLKKNLLEMIRNKKIIIFGVVFVILSVLSAGIAKVLPILLEFLLEGIESNEFSGLYISKATVADSYIQYISNMGETAILLIILMFAGTITKEKKNGTYDSLKMNNVKDKEIVLAHFVSQVILITVSYALSIAIFAILNILLFRQIMGLRGIVILTYIYLLLLVALAFTLFASCISKTTGKAYLIVILGYFGASLLEIIPRVNVINPFHLLSVSNKLVSYEVYSLKENLITSISTLIIGVILVIISVFVVKNKINNRKVISNGNNTEGI